MTPQEIQKIHTIITDALGAYLVTGKRYPTALPADLAPWYCYTSDGGHSIVVVLMNQVQPGATVTDFLVPAPVKAVLRAGYTLRDGFVWCDLHYDATLGLVTEPGDDEY